MEILYANFAKRSLTENLQTELLQRACSEISSRNLAKRPLIGSLYRDLANRAVSEILYRMYRDIAKMRSCQERGPISNIVNIV